MAKDRVYFASLQECNENCLFCVRGGKAKSIKYLDTKAAKKKIDKAAKEKWQTFIFDGGEPTLREDIAELVGYAVERGFKNVSILTNGIKLAEKGFLEAIIKEVEKIKKGKVNLSFGISLHSHKKEISEFLVGRAGTFEATIKGISNALMLKLPVSIYHVITSKNYKDLPDFVDFLHKKFPKIKNLTFSFIYPAGAALENVHIFAKISQMEPYLYRAMEKAKKYRMDFSISTCGTIPLCYLKGYEIYTINQQKLDSPENVGISDSTLQKRSKLATEEFHKESKVKGPKCKLCLLNRLCGGLWKVYAEQYGLDELKPVTDDSKYKTVKVDLQKLEGVKKKLLDFKEIFFVDFRPDQLNGKEGIKRAADFVGWLKKNQLNYLIKRPFEKLSIPQDYQNDLEHPVSPYLYVGLQCNNNCIFCSEADEYMENLRPKTFEEIKKEMKKVRKGYDFVNLMGREPTLRSDFLDILELAQSLGFRQIGFTTNGRMLAYPEFAKEVLEAGVNQIVISLAGASAQIHDRETQAAGSFNQTLSAIKNVIRFKRPEVSLIVNIPLNRLNYRNLKPTLELLLNLGVKEINLLFIAPLSKRSRSKKIVMKMSQLGKYVFEATKPYSGKSGIKFLLVEFLPCSLPRKARNYFFPCLEKNPSKVRIPLCAGCSYRDQCDGVLEDYIRLYGKEEFKL